MPADADGSVASMHDLALRVLRLFERLDASTRALSEASGLSCLPGCGACCLSPEVETTVLELLPLAFEFWRRGALATWSERLAATGGAGRCALYEPDPADPRSGRCGAYAWRPSVCRIFGFAARRDREGGVRFMTCAPLSAERGEAVARARALGDAGFPLVLYGDVARELAALAPDKGTRLEPINRALAGAIALVGLLARYTAEAADMPDGDHEPFDRPTRPPSPRRAA